MDLGADADKLLTAALSRAGQIHIDDVMYPSGTAGQHNDPVTEIDGLINIMGDKQGGQINMLHNLQIPLMHTGLGQRVQGTERLIQKGNSAGT